MSSNIAQTVVAALEDLKARDICVLDVSDQTSITDTMIIASGTSDRQVRSMAEKVIEECKADTLGMYNSQFLIDQEVLPKSLEDTLYATYLAGMFRSIRFGIDEAHGGGVAMQLNYLLEKGAFQLDEDGRFFVDYDKIKEVIKDLSHALLMIQAEGDYEAAQKFINNYCYTNVDVEAALETLVNVPTDIRPVFPIEKEIRR